jgi:hypothetical protein
MGGCPAEVPVKYVESLFDRMPDNYLFEEFESAISVCVVREEGNGSVATMCLSEDVEKLGRSTYGQERTETREMPMMRAYLTRKAIRKAVIMPPQKTATQSYFS